MLILHLTFVMRHICSVNAVPSGVHIFIPEAVCTDDVQYYSIKSSWLESRRSNDDKRKHPPVKHV